MLPEIELLQYIHKTAEMGCQGILTVLEHTKDTPLHQVLEEQRAEYQKLGREAEKLLSQRGEDATKLGAMAKISSEVMSRIARFSDVTEVYSIDEADVAE